MILLFRVEDAELIYRDAARLNLTGAGSVWIVTEQALNLTNAPIGKLLYIYVIKALGTD